MTRDYILITISIARYTGTDWSSSSSPFGYLGNRHLCLAFFDVLHLDGRSLLLTPYERRRAVLERLINVIPGFVGRRTFKPIQLIP